MAMVDIVSRGSDFIAWEEKPFLPSCILTILCILASAANFTQVFARLGVIRVSATFAVSSQRHNKSSNKRLDL
jgi:hypothetical protein